MTIILDLDDTLVDTSGFKEVLFRSLEHAGISRAVVAASYARLRARHDFSVNGLYRALPGDQRPPWRAYEAALRRVLGHYPFRMYPDVRWFLTRLRGHRRILYTYGDALVQSLKVRSLRLRTLFHEVVITDDRTKLRDLTRLAPPDTPVVLVDNDPRFIERVRIRFPHIRAFCITRRRLFAVGAYPDLRSIERTLVKEGLL